MCVSEGQLNSIGLLGDGGPGSPSLAACATTAVSPGAAGSVTKNIPSLRGELL